MSAPPRLVGSVSSDATGGDGRDEGRRGEPAMVSTPTPLLPAPAASGTELHPVVTQQEKRGWLLYDWANSPTSSSVLSGFLPLLIQECALAVAGFPYVCPNVITAAPALATVYGNTTSLAAMYVMNDFTLSPLPTGCREVVGIVPNVTTATTALARNIFCEGTPTSQDMCLTAAGQVADKFPLKVRAGGREWNPTAYSSAIFSIAVGLQIFVYIAVGPFADYGSLRKRLMQAVTFLGALAVVLTMLITPATFEASGVLAITINVCYGVSFVMYNAYLPALVQRTPEVLSASKEQRHDVYQRTMDTWSSQGFALGYVAGILVLFINLAIAIGLSNSSILAYRINCLVCGIWWFAFSMFTWAWVKPRPGPPLPKGTTFLLQPWKSLCVTLGRARQLPYTFVFLITWFAYSDAYSGIGNIGAMFANAAVSWSGFNKTIGLAILLLIPPIFAAIGNYFWNWVAARFKLRAPVLISINLALIALVPLYGLTGLASTRVGYRVFWELYLAVVMYGFNLGSLQAFSRSLFSTIIPPAMESQFFSLYNISDRGSTFISPLIFAAIIDTTGNLRLSFIYTTVALLVPIIPLLWIDVRKASDAAHRYSETHAAEALAVRTGSTPVATKGQVGGSPDAEGGDHSRDGCGTFSSVCTTDQVALVGSMAGDNTGAVAAAGGDDGLELPRIPTNATRAEVSSGKPAAT